MIKEQSDVIKLKKKRRKIFAGRSHNFEVKIKIT